MDTPNRGSITDSRTAPTNEEIHALLKDQDGRWPWVK
jgi:hypothetical protein